jgi:hypothetical protein
MSGPIDDDLVKEPLADFIVTTMNDIPGYAVEQV